MAAKKGELESLLNQRTIATMSRTKSKWTCEGEKNTKYFHNLEKARYNAKTYHALLQGETLIEDPSKILRKKYNFYKELYKSDPNVELAIPDIVSEKVPPKSPRTSSQQITAKELRTATRSMKNNSFPGPDGIPAK